MKKLTIGTHSPPLGTAATGHQSHYSDMSKSTRAQLQTGRQMNQGTSIAAGTKGK